MKVSEKTSEIKAPGSQITVVNSKALTDEEKGKVKKAVEDANPNLPEGATIEVSDDGSVTIKDKTGKEIGKISSDKTVKQDDSKLAVKKPALVEVKDPENVTGEEQEKIKEEIKKANPDLADATITVDNKGNVTITKDGKTGKLSPAQTIKKSGETGEKTALKDPSKVAVKDPSNLTEDEKAAIKEAVKKANPDLEDEEISVDKEGNVTVTKAGEQAKTISKDKTVSTDIKTPELTEVANPAELTNDEKISVKNAVKEANTDLTDDQIEVKDDGTVVVTKDGKEIIIPAKDVVKKKEIKAVDKNKLKAEVDKENATKATDKYKNADSDKKKAYDDALDAAKKVLDNPNATQEQINKALEKLKTAETELNGEKSPTIKAPESQITVVNSKELTDEEKGKVKKAVEDANPNLPEGTTIEVSDDGSVTIKDKTGKEIGKISPDKTVKQDDSRLEIKIPESIKVKNKDSLSNEDKQAIKDAIKKANPELNLTDDDIIVNDDGSVKVKKNGKEASISADKLNIFSKGEAEVHDKSELKIADLVEPKVSKKIKVKDKNNLTNKEKEKIQKAIKEANKNNFPQGTKVVVNNDGSVDIIYPDGSKDSIKASKLVEEESVETGKLTKKVKKDKDAKDNSNGKSKNISTGIESQAGIIATLIGSVGGLFASRKKKNK